jgi:hypothetical protein
MKPKFKLRDTVNHPKDLYGFTESIITKVSRIFDNHDGNLAYVESNLSFRDDIKWEIKKVDGVDCLVIQPYKTSAWCMAHERMEECMSELTVVKFSGYVYTVSNVKMNTLFDECSLKRKPTLKISDLYFGRNILKGDYMAYDISDSQRRINDEDALEEVKSALIDNFGDMEVTIDTEQPWNSVITIPSLLESRQNYVLRKSETLKKWGTTE